MQGTKKPSPKGQDGNAAKPASHDAGRDGAAPENTHTPRPLHLHLLNTMNMLATAAWPFAAMPEARNKIMDAISDMTRDMMDGIQAYRTSPHHAARPDYDALWESGSVRLLRPYADAKGAPVLVVPSLINRFHILDIEDGHSFIACLRDRGFNPLIIDWGTPDGAERSFNIDTYIMDRLSPALAFAARTFGPVHMVGYCMGGTLAVAAASLSPQHVKSLVALAAPWDFHAGDDTIAQRMRAFCVGAEGVMNAQGVLPVDWIQALFASIDPLFAFNKFRNFAKVAPDADEARRFVLVEDWLNDGVDLAAPAARQALLQWYGDNEPASGVWTLGAHLVDATRIDTPALIVAAGDDRLVPEESAMALARAIDGAQHICPAIGHIGMMASNRAREEVWAPVAAWLAER